MGLEMEALEEHRGQGGNWNWAGISSSGNAFEVPIRDGIRRGELAVDSVPP